MPDGLSAQLLAALALPGPGCDGAALEQRLGEAVVAARAAWPEVRLADEDFVRHLARHLDGVDAGRLADELAALAAADLFLAGACAAGSAPALVAFERLLAQVPAALARFSPSPAFVDEVLQVLRERLLVARGAAPAKIADYGGRGPLVNWLRVAAVRAALDLRRNQDDRLDGGLSAVEAAPPVVAGDVEAQFLRERYRAEFNQAFAAAVAALDATQRSVLRMHFLDGLTLEQVAAAVRVGRATATRWIAAARAAVWAETERRLRERLRLSESEFESLAAALRSQLDVSFAALRD